MSKERENKSVYGTNKKILDVTCGSRSIWFNHKHPAAVYMDKRREVGTRIWKSGDGTSERFITVNPDVIADFTQIPFDDNSFSLVVFDPPHLTSINETSWLAKKYGRLDDNWPQMLHDGFTECMRVLKQDGVLIFKWSEYDIPADRVRKVEVRELLPNDDEMTYGVYEVSSGRRVDAGYGSPWVGFRKHALYDNKEDCKDQAHLLYNGWEELRKLQEAENR